MEPHGKRIPYQRRVSSAKQSAARHEVAATANHRYEGKLEDRFESILAKSNRKREPVGRTTQLKSRGTRISRILTIPWSRLLPVSKWWKGDGATGVQAKFVAISGYHQMSMHKSLDGGLIVAPRASREVSFLDRKIPLEWWRNSGSLASKQFAHVGVDQYRSNRSKQYKWRTVKAN